jgi:NitT/TauT family transport system ATP-binding protein
VEQVDLCLQAGEFVGLVGPTGCDKSMLRNVITGLARPFSGSVTIFGEPLADINDKAGYML